MKRTYLRVTLQPQGRWRVGAWDSGADDLAGTLRSPLDPAQPWIAGSSVVGSLVEAAGAEASELFGPPPEAKPLRASPWWVLGTVVDGGTIDVRGRNRIDRVRRAAATRGLVDMEEASGTITVYMRGDNADLEPLLHVIRHWRPVVGGGRTVGLGHATVTSVRHRTVTLDDPQGLREFLCAGGDAITRVDQLLRNGTDEVIENSPPPEYIHARVAIEHLASQDRIPGSTWKGLLRSRVEFIGRSLGYDDVCGRQESEWEGCGSCAVCQAFGSTKRRGCWEFRDSIWEEGTASPKVRSRIAIDRFTGGTRSGALWTQHDLPVVAVTLSILGVSPAEPWVEAALLHALRDLHEGLVTVGPNGAAGFGWATVSEMIVNGVSRDVATPPDVPTPEDGAA